jgi:hypothetical protein
LKPSNAAGLIIAGNNPLTTGLDIPNPPPNFQSLSLEQLTRYS